MITITKKVQILKKGVFFPARAGKLFMLYNHYNALEEIPEKIQKGCNGVQRMQWGAKDAMGSPIKELVKRKSTPP